MAWFQDLFGKRSSAKEASIAPAANPHTDAVCSFCRQSRLHVKKIIAGPDRVYICDTCVEDCVGVLGQEAEVPSPVAMALSFVLRGFQRFVDPADLAETSRLVDAALALAGGDAAACRQIAAAAAHVRDPVAAARALARIPEGERTVTDRVNEALLHDTAGATERAIEALDALDVTTFTAEERIIVPLHRASLRLAAEVATLDEAQAFDALADEVAAALPSLGLPEPYAFDLGREICLGRARAARVLDDLDRVVALLEPHVAAHADGHALAVLHEVHLARNDGAAALAAKARALTALHPASALAIKLRARRP